MPECCSGRRSAPGGRSTAPRGSATRSTGTTGRRWGVAPAATAAAAPRPRRPGEPVYEDWSRRLWDHAASRFIDLERGSWHHELTPDNTPAAAVWPGKPDVYHAYQATLLPQLPLAPGLAVALRDRLGV